MIVKKLYFLSEQQTHTIEKEEINKTKQNKTLITHFTSIKIFNEY